MDQVTQDSILYGSTPIVYNIEYAQRKTLHICVQPDGSVHLKVPVKASREQIQQKVHKRACWILRQKRYFESFGTPTVERQYVSGESYLYLGRQYMLRVKDSNVDAVHYQNNVLEVECRHRKDVGVLLQTWYRQRAKVKFAEYAKPIIKRFSTYGVAPHYFSIRKMDKRWGYCTVNGDIFLNPRLICAPRCCIEYVIAHEMCHLVHRNHTKEFYALLAQEMPHWEKWKMKLEKTLFQVSS
ncbi:MAG: M48 family metallopeptidase [Muribaculaceae bacterium]|nr:M48 family metallopeptidase [Muribaculaceae bacterium]